MKSSTPKSATALLADSARRITVDDSMDRTTTCQLVTGQSVTDHRPLRPRKSRPNSGQPYVDQRLTSVVFFYLFGWLPMVCLLSADDLKTLNCLYVGMRSAGPGPVFCRDQLNLRPVVGSSLPVGVKVKCIQCILRTLHTFNV